MEPETATAADPQTPADEFAIVELLGHRRNVGRIMEVERFGAKLLRIDIPKDGKFENGYSTHFYSGAALYCITPCDLATVERANRPYQAASLITYEDGSEED